MDHHHDHDNTIISGAGTNLKVGGTPVRSESGGGSKTIFFVFLHFWALKAQLVVLVNAFVMVSKVWSMVSFLFAVYTPLTEEGPPLK